MNEPIKRDLDGFYFRVKRDDEWDSICFSDMTRDERMSIMKDKDVEWLKSLCNALAECLRAVGDEFNIVAMDDDVDDDIGEIPFAAYDSVEEAWERIEGYEQKIEENTISEV